MQPIDANFGLHESPQPFEGDSSNEVDLDSPVMPASNDGDDLAMLRSGGMLDALPPPTEAESLDAIRAARDALAAEREELERAIGVRQQDLASQSREIEERRRALDDRERSLLEANPPAANPSDSSDDEDDALPEWLAPAPKRKFAGNVTDTYAIEAESLRKQVRELEASVSLLHAERDNAWTQLEEMRRAQNALRERLRRVDPEFRKADPPPRPSSPRTHHGLDRVDLDGEWAETDRLRVKLNELERENSELRDRLRAASQAPPADTKARAMMDQLMVERDLARAERDTALAELKRLQAEPPNWKNSEADYASIRMQVKRDQRKVDEDVRELHRKEAELHAAIDEERRQLESEQSRLERLEHDLNEQVRGLREEKDRIEIRERELRLRDTQLHLREAEIRELREIAELECARERAELNQERIRLARSREQIRLERESLASERDERDAADDDR